MSRLDSTNRYISAIHSLSDLSLVTIEHGNRIKVFSAALQGTNYTLCTCSDGTNIRT